MATEVKPKTKNGSKAKAGAPSRSYPDLHEHLKALDEAGLLVTVDRRINKEGVIIIKAQQFRSQDKNREDALRRLQELIGKAMVTRKQRKPTRPTRSSQRKRMDNKTRRGQTKSLRSKISHD